MGMTHMPEEQQIMSSFRNVPLQVAKWTVV